MPFSTQREVDRLVPPTGKTDGFHFDTACRGLSVRIQGSKRTWVVHYTTHDKKRRRLDLGGVAGLSLRDARVKANEIVGKAKDGADPLAERAAKASAPKKMSLGDLVDRFIRIYAEKNQRPKTLAETKRALNVHMKPLHDHLVDEVSRRDLAQRFQALAESSGPIMANRVRAATSTLFSWSMKQGLAEVNPVVGTAPPAAENKRDRVLSEEELRFVWHALEACTPDYRDVVRLLLLLGQRANEVAGMRWSEVDLERGLWTLPALRTKNGLAHEVPLPSQGFAILQSRQSGRDSDRDLVFGRRAGPFSGWSVAKEKMDLQLTVLRAEQRLCRKLKVEEKPLAVDALAPWVVHDLRRTVVTGMSELNVEPHIVEGIVNHVGAAKAGVAGVYNHARYRPQKAAALQRWADHLGAVIGL